MEHNKLPALIILDEENVQGIREQRAKNCTLSVNFRLVPDIFKKGWTQNPDPNQLYPNYYSYKGREVIPWIKEC